MEMTLAINTVSCITCGKCIKVCPSRIFTQNDSGGQIITEHMEGCIRCGHCVAVCPTDSVIHSEFPADKVHRIDYSQMPTPEQMMLLCKVRRSNRAFSKQSVPATLLDQILEAAHRAPTASNLQQVDFTLITDLEKLNWITDFTLGVFASVVKRLENPLLKPLLSRMMPAVYRYVPNFHRLIREREQGNDLILRGATALILIHTPEQSRFGCQDANLAYENGSLMAETLGVSQFYTGFVCSAIKQDHKHALARQFGIKGTIHAGMALGMPAFRYPNYIDRKEIHVTKM